MAESLLEMLEKAGLTGNEAKVYLELLKRGSISANELAKKLGMDRTLTYQILNNLIEKGLVHYIIKHHKKYFEVADPKNLLNAVKEKEALIKHLIPELKSIEKIKEVEQEINVYEGKEGIRSFVGEFLKEKTFYAFGSTGRIYDIFYEMPAIAKRALKQGIKVKIIMNPKYRKHRSLKLKGIEARFLNVECDATTTISGDSIAIHLIREKEKPIAIVIKNKEIAYGYKNYFDFLWKHAKP